MTRLAKAAASRGRMRNSADSQPCLSPDPPFARRCADLRVGVGAARGSWHATCTASPAAASGGCATTTARPMQPAAPHDPTRRHRCLSAKTRSCHPPQRHSPRRRGAPGGVRAPPAPAPTRRPAPRTGRAAPESCVAQARRWHSSAATRGGSGSLRRCMAVLGAPERRTASANSVACSMHAMGLETPWSLRGDRRCFHFQTPGSVSGWG